MWQLLRRIAGARVYGFGDDSATELTGDGDYTRGVLRRRQQINNELKEMRLDEASAKGV